MYKEMVAVCFESRTNNKNTLCGWDEVFLMLKLAVYIVTTEF